MPSDAEKLRAALDRLGRSNAEIARRWRLDEGKAPRTGEKRLQRWCNGKAPIPGWVWVIVDFEEGNLHPRRAG